MAVDAGESRSRLGSFLLGGLLGGLAGFAASRLRLPGNGSPRRVQPGLSAFEEAPCYAEFLEHEREAETLERQAR